MNQPTQLWVRGCAGAMDLTAIAAATALTAQAMALWGRHVPVEWGILGGYFALGVLFTGVVGQTPGQWLCGLRVVRTGGGRPGPAAALVRAGLSTLFLLPAALPFLTAAARRDRRGWHDLVTGTRVETVAGTAVRRHRTGIAAAIVIGLWGGAHAVAWANLYRMHRGFLADAASIEAGRPQAEPPDAAAVDAAFSAEIGTWLAEHSTGARDYLVDFAGRHRVTIVGEVHGKRQFLVFLADSIEDLYHQGGIRAIALECCLSSLEKDVHRLVTADTYDRTLALAIAREGAWHAWGYKEHWDILESVWRLNRSLPAGSEPLRVVGLCPPADLISLRLAKEGDLMCLLRALGDMPMAIMADAFYARQVERAAFDAGRRTLVWVGAGHAWKCHSAQRQTDRGVTRYYRMGAMLHGRYGEQVGTLLLHNAYSFPRAAAVVENHAHAFGPEGTGFDLLDSPLGQLGDRSSAPAASGVNLPLHQYACGYLVVAELDEIEPCTWWEGFISPRMFGLYRSYYEMLCGRELRDHEQANAYIQQAADRI